MAPSPHLRRPRSGSLLVLGLLALGIVFTGLTWIQYRRENPTSVTATLTRSGDRWSAYAQFSPAGAKYVKTGTRAVVTSPALAGQTLAGTVEATTPDGHAVIALAHTPSGMQAFDSAPCTVTVDSATAPR